MTEREIERKFLVDPLQMPRALDEYPHVAIRQGYMAVAADGAEVRLRRKDERCFLTFKSAGDLTRGEIEIELTDDQFEALWPATENQRIEKRRYEIEHEQGLIEVDAFEGDLAGMVTAEMEFPTEDASRAFRPPAWFAAEVTYDQRYKNKNLAQFGAP